MNPKFERFCNVVPAVAVLVLVILAVGGYALEPELLPLSMETPVHAIMSVLLVMTCALIFFPARDALRVLRRDLFGK